MVVAKEPSENWKMRAHALGAMERWFDKMFERKARLLEAEIANDG
jgi:hypothetical protein